MNKKATLVIMLMACFLTSYAPRVEKENIIIEQHLQEAVVSTIVEEPVNEDLVENRFHTVPLNSYRGNPVPEGISQKANYCYQYGDGNKFNGYYYYIKAEQDDCVINPILWIPGVPTVETQFMEMPTLVQGNVLPYAPNMMEATALTHDLPLHHFPVIDGITLPFCSEIGNYVWVKREHKEWEGPYLVVDCAGLMDLYNVVVHRDEVAEIGFKTAVAWGMARVTGWNSHKFLYTKEENVMVSKIHPTCLSDEEPIVNLEEYFIENAVYYKTESDYKSNFLSLRVLDRYVDLGGERSMFWRLRGEWVEFKLNEIVECE